jgi:hypothetical protein
LKRSPASGIASPIAPFNVIQKADNSLKIALA